MEDITKLDLYDLLQIADDAGDKEIKTAYRKKALKCHPDKNPDNPVAVALFHQLSKALEILTDAKARDAYDRLLKARKAAEIRNRQLDSKRRKLKQDLESREKDAEARQNVPVDVGKKLREEVERLRRDGSRQLEEEIEMMRQQIQQEMERLTTNKAPKVDHQDGATRVKVQWKRCKGGQLPYDHNVLTEIFSKYGKIGCVVASGKRAIVEFEDIPDTMVDRVQSEVGLAEFPLQVTLLDSGTKRKPEEKRVETRPVPESPPPATTTNVGGGGDYEDLVLTRLRQAQERKRLIQQMEQEDD